MPHAIRGGVRADRSPTYVIAVPEITTEVYADTVRLSGSENIDVTAVAYGDDPDDGFRLFAALRRRGGTLRFLDHRLWWLSDRLPPFVAGPGEPSVIIKRGQPIVTNASHWCSMGEWDRGLAQGDRLARDPIWADD